jgi:hypothetical protein
VSVTFWVQKDPGKEQKELCYCVDDTTTLETSPLHAMEGCPVCGGAGWVFVSVNTLPSLNITNVSARNLLNAVGVVSEELAGTIPLSALRDLRQRVFVLVNSKEERDKFLSPTREEERFVDVGIDAGRFTRHLYGLWDVLIAAQNAKSGVSFG